LLLKRNFFCWNTFYGLLIFSLEEV
jgi:hypothetical protein